MSTNSSQIKGANANNIVGWGYSLGSGAVSKLAEKHNIDVVLDRPFSTMSHVAYDVAPTGLKWFSKLFFRIGAHFDNVEKLKSVTSRIFIAQGKYDENMDEKLHGKRLQQGLKDKHITYKKVNSTHHHANNSIWFDKNHPEDRSAVEEFLSEPRDQSVN